MMALVIFDIDNTLISGQTHWRFLRYLRRERILGTLPFLLTGAWFLLYRIGIARRPEHIMNYALSVASGWEISRLSELAEKFLSSEFKPEFFPKALSVLRSHQLKGDRILILTNLIEPLANGIASELGVPDLIATRLEQRDGRYTGRIEGGLIYGEAKLSRLTEFARTNALDLGEAWAYGDHESDMFFMEKVGHPVLVNPGSRLRQVASAKGWMTSDYKK